MPWLCKWFGHQRRHGHVSRNTLEFRSVCRRCAAPMIRPIGSRDWRPLDAPVPLEAPVPPEASAHR